MSALSRIRTLDRLGTGIERIYRETMATTPGDVEVCLGLEVLTAFLRDCACAAEKTLWPREDGSRLLQEYHAACANELIAPLHGLVRKILGQDLLHVWLHAVPDTKDKLLVLILTKAPDATGEET
ncbi:MAG: DUF2294 family protein [Deltaproteobacteria bacterium]|nr:DUF2294 family protein [Deltaproteobacteria bacterium]